MTIATETPQAIAMPDTPEWHAARARGVGASEAAAACGLSSYKTTTELYLQKIGESEPLEMNRDLLFGKFMESGGIQYSCAMRDRQVQRYPLPIAVHPDYPFILATGDAELSDREGLEFKTMDWFVFRRLQEEGIQNTSPGYVLQAQQQMAVMGWDVVTVAIMVGKDLHDVIVERNERLIDLIIDRETEFWGYVERRQPPPIDFSHEGALRTVKALYPKIKTTSVVRLSDAASEALEQYKADAETIKAAKKRQDAAKAKALAEIGETFGGLLPDGKTMLRRKWIEGTTYTVERAGYFNARTVKYDGSSIIETEGEE